MSFSSKLQRFLKVSSRISAPILAAVGVPPVYIPFIQHGLENAEIASEQRTTPLTGAEKKALVLDSLATAGDIANAAKPGSFDPAIVAVTSNGIDTVVGTINVIQKAKTTTTATE